MGSSNGVTRGQLRPYFSGRTPPFILVGTLIILIIFGFSYWSLNSQYNDLQVELHEFQDQLRAAAQKRLESEKRASSLQDQLVSAEEKYSKCKTGLEKKEEEFAEISQQLRDEVTKVSSQAEEIRINLEKCEEDKLKREGECSKQQDHAKQLDVENAELKERQHTLKEKINALENVQKQMDTQNHVEVKTPFPNSVPSPESVKAKDAKVEENATHAESKNAEVPVPITPANPDIGIPPGSDGGNDVQDKGNFQQKDVLVNPNGIPENPPLKGNLLQQKEVPVPSEKVVENNDANDANSHNGGQSRLGEDMVNPQQ